MSVNPQTINFGSVAVRTKSAKKNLSFTVSGAVTLGNVSVVTEGAPNLDFTVVPGGTTCASGTTGKTCVVQVQFLPTLPGPRMGGVVLSDLLGNTLIAAPLYGLGTGPVVAFGPGTMSTAVGGTMALSTVGLSYPNGVGVDAAGNIYAASSYVSTVYKVTPAGVVTTIAGGNGQGYFGDGGLATAAKLYYPTTVRLDGPGNIYITDSGNNAIRMINPAGIITTVAGLPPGGQICAQAIDQFGDGCPATQATLNLASAWGIGGTATDAAGNLYIPDSGNFTEGDNNGRIRKVTPNGNITTVAGNGIAGYSGDGGPATSAEMWGPVDIVVDGRGNLYIADDYNHAIRKVSVSNAPSLTFPNTTYGTTSAPQDVEVLNLGNTSLTISPASTSTSFPLVRSTTSSGSIRQTLAPAANYILGVEFTPKTTGSINGSVVLTDNAHPATRTIALQGNGTPATPTISWQTPAAITYGTVLSHTQLNATTSVPGSFVYSPAAKTVLPAGTHILSVTFTPSNSADYTSATASVTLQVNQATPKINWAQPWPIAYGIALSSKQLNATASYDYKPVPGIFTYTPASGTVLTGGLKTLSVTFTPSDQTDYSTVTASVTLRVNPITPTISWTKPATISYGTALGLTQLDATASVPGDVRLFSRARCSVGERKSYTVRDLYADGHHRLRHRKDLGALAGQLNIRGNAGPLRSALLQL